MILRINKTGIIVVSIIFFPICNLLGDIPVVSYYDELIGLVTMMSVLSLFIAHRLDNIDKKVCIIMIIITSMGITSNVYNQLIDNVFAITVDILWLWKTFACFIGYKYFSAKNGRRSAIIDLLVPVAKLSIVIVFATAMIGQFIDIGVTGKVVFGGLNQFLFFWNNTIQTGWLLFSSIMILSASKLRKNIFRVYVLLAVIPALLTFSSLVYCWFIIEITLLVMLSKNKKLKKRNIVFFAIGIGLTAMADIRTYFLSESVRMKMIKGGIVTANTYFPLGSGFATYGSDMAARYYSQLYMKYGWEYAWGLGKMNGQYLNDNFFAGVLAQFGWIGFALYLTIIYMLFKYVNTILLNKSERASAIATVLTLTVVMIGSASVKSMMGVCTFAVLGILSSKKFIVENNFRN